MKNVLVVAAHPDDELLGLGGTLIKHRLAGDSVYCIIIGEGLMSRNTANQAELQELYRHAQNAGAIIGFKGMTFEHFPDNAFDTVSLLKIAKVVEDHLERTRPDIIYTHHEYDLNIDHRLTFEAVLVACRPYQTFAPQEIYTFETLSSTEWHSKDHKQFAPDTYINISSTIDQKIEALKEYQSELRPYPHARSIEGIRIRAQYRGLESHLPYAEAFMTIRRIQQ